MSHDVFISYATPDRAVAFRICRFLEKTGIACWIAPRDIRGGLDWAAAIDKAIPASRALLLVVSPSANRSAQIPHELAIAGSNRLAIVPVRIRNVSPASGINYWLANVHWLDAFPGPVEAHASRIITSLRDLLGMEPAQPVSRLRLWSEANRSKLLAGAGIAAVAAVFAVVPRSCPEYRVRVALFDPDARAVEAATITSNSPREFRRIADGWEIDIPRASKPPDSRLSLRASSMDGGMKGSAELTLGSDCAPAVNIQLRREPDVTVGGTVFDSDGRFVAGARVSVANHESEFVVTGSDGSFRLSAHAPAGSMVVLHVEKDGFPSVDQRHFAGPDPAAITLTR